MKSTNNHGIAPRGYAVHGYGSEWTWCIPGRMQAAMLADGTKAVFKSKQEAITAAWVDAQPTSDFSQCLDKGALYEIL
ncbi:hypothetical protein ACT3T8_16075 [Halomonas sp. AOP1-B1-8]|uniref:hypothetical protein n=1 Tax=Halomonas sp. AOP1-B1-8 TaxID=3457726 RepID=UPI003FD9FDC6